LKHLLGGNDELQTRGLQNGSGKSNFISVFRLLENIYNQRLQSYVKQNGGAERFFHNRFKAFDFNVR
jgi:hypothetical protein